MNAQNGFYGVRKNDAGITSIFIDEETLEFGQLRRMVDENSRQAAENRRKKLEAAAETQAKKTATERKAQRRAKNLVKQEAKLVAGSMVVLLAQFLGAVTWWFTVPVILALVAAIFFKAGRYFGMESGAKK